MSIDILRPFIVVSCESVQKLSVSEEYFVSRLALGYSLASSGLKTELLKDKNGKPSYKRGVYWSLSHKKFVGAGVASDSEVGIDVEIIRELDPWFGKRTAKDCEWDILGGYNTLNFYKNWTAKEALLKSKRLSVFRMGGINIINDYGEKVVLKDEKGKQHVVSFFIDDNIISAVTMDKQSILWGKKVF